MNDKCKSYAESLSSPPSHAFTVVPDDAVDLIHPTLYQRRYDKQRARYHAGQRNRDPSDCRRNHISGPCAPGLGHWHDSN
jgi:hypothetical protein